MERKIVVKQDVLDALVALGVKSGQTIMVHTSLSSLGFVCGGAQIIIEALLETVGNEGTIVMPTQSWKNLDPCAGVHWDEPEAWWPIIRENWPAYHKDITPTNTMGAVAEMFRKWPGTLRSDPLCGSQRKTRPIPDCGSRSFQYFWGRVSHWKAL